MFIIGRKHFDSWKGATQGLKHTLTAEKAYLINFTKVNTKLSKLAL